jgi:hypothetical protein
MSTNTNKNDDEEKNFEVSFAAVKLDLDTSSALSAIRLKFDLSATGLITSLLSALMGVAKAAYIEKYKNDFHKQEVVDSLKDELKKINEKLDTLLTADLKAAGMKFSKANNLLALEDDVEAAVSYRAAEDTAIDAIARVPKIDQLVQAYKIKLLSEFMRIQISCKSIASEDERSKKMRNFCINASMSLNELHTNPKIISAVERQIMKPPLIGGNKKERESMLSELYKLDNWILNLASQFQVDRNTVYKNLITSTKKAPVDDVSFANTKRTYPGCV